MQVQQVVGDSFPDSDVAQLVVKHNFNVEATIDFLVASPRKPDESNFSFFASEQPSKSTLSSQNRHETKRTLNLTDASSNGATKPDELPEKLPNGSGPVLYESQFSRLTVQNGESSGLTVSTNTTNCLQTSSQNVVTPKAEVAASSSEHAAFVLDEKTKTLLKEQSGEKPVISIVVIGHVDAGKSTLIGQLLYKIGHVTKKEMNKFEQESKKEGKSSFALAWVMDENTSERSRGVTMEISERYFETKKYHVAIVDAPGHKDFVPAMITGAAEADAAFLVVDATVNAFESGFNGKDISLGQTSEHSVLARSLGITNLVVVINKIDTCMNPQERMQQIKSTLLPFLTKKAGFKENDVQFLPCSGFHGTNIKEKGSNLDWFKGPTLLEAIDLLPAPTRAVDQQLCLAVTDLVKVSSNNVTISGVVKTGFVKHNEKVLLQPANISATLKGIKVLDGSSKSSSAAGSSQIAVAGSHIHAVLNVDASAVVSGSFVCSLNSNTISVTNCFHARIVTFNTEEILLRGSAAEMHYICIAEPVYIKKIVSLLDKSGTVTKRNPKFVPKNSSAIVVLELQRNICVHLFKVSKALGRFMLRLNGATVAAGIVEKV